MKKKIGNLEGYAIIEGDRNLLETNHEIHIDDLKGNNSNNDSSSDKQYKIITEDDIEKITYRRHDEMVGRLLDLYIKIKGFTIKSGSVLCNYYTFNNYDKHVTCSSYIDSLKYKGQVYLEFNADNFTMAEGGTIRISSEDSVYDSPLNCETKKLILLFDQN